MEQLGHAQCRGGILESELILLASVTPAKVLFKKLPQSSHLFLF
jgi:hypothetical protein